MEGPKFAKRYVTEYLAADLPTRLVRYRNDQNLDANRLPNPALYLSYEPHVIDSWPTIINLVETTLGVERDDYALDGTFGFRVRYLMRTYVWARGEATATANSFEMATQVRDDLTTVVRAALLDGPSLRQNDANKCAAQVGEETVREVFSDVTPLKGERAMAGAYITYELALTEGIVDDTTYGLFSGILLDVDPIPHLPNAPRYPKVTAGDGEVRMSWRASTWDGGHALLGYQIEASTDNGTTWSVVVADTEGTIPIHTITGLTNGTEYRFRVAAFNQDGVGEVSVASLPVTPSA